MKNLFLIKTDFENTRLDRWFRKNVCDVPQSLIEKNIRKGCIIVNKKRVKSSYKVQINDKIELRNIYLKPSIHKEKKFSYIATKKDLNFTSSIFIEDNENFAVINKPSGISVQSGTKSKRNILDILRSTKEFEDTMPYTVHRIDKETTGILVVAKNRKYAQLFTSLFRIRKIHKIYLGISLGEFQKKKGILKDELFYYEGNKKIITKAHTNYEVLDSNNYYSLLKLNPITGRKHQLRKQLLIHGHPIIGDTKYKLSFNKLITKNNLMLHAYKINFSIAGKKYAFTANPPQAFSDFLKQKYLKSF